jgi:small subunit ribosomal protein S3Ae
MKNWYIVSSPPYFGGIEIGTTPSAAQSTVIGRVVSTTLYDITGDPSQLHLQLYFQIVGVKDSKASTVFKGHEYSRDYLRSLVRRGSTRIDGIFNVSTKDGYKLRISVVAFSVLRAKSSQITEVRKIIQKHLEEKAKTLSFDQFVQEAVLGKIASDIYNEAKKVVPIRHVGVRKSVLLSSVGEAQEAEELEVKAA